MASGLPDFWRSIDVAGQSLAEMINRPKYGGAIQVAGSLTVTAMLANVLFLIEGQGMIYGGTLWLDYTSSQGNAEIQMKLDGVGIGFPSLVRMKNYSMNHPRSSIVSLNTFDSVNNIYSVGLSYGITFESSFQLAYSENNGGTPLVWFNIFYTLI